MYKKLDSLNTRTVEKGRGGQGKIYSKDILLEKDFGCSITHLIFVTIPPGSSVGFHQHTGDEEVYFILEGSGTVRDDGREYEVGVYDTVLTNSGHSHGIENTGGKDLKMLAIVGKL